MRLHKEALATELARGSNQILLETSSLYPFLVQ